MKITNHTVSSYMYIVKNINQKGYIHGWGCTVIYNVQLCLASYPSLATHSSISSPYLASTTQCYNTHACVPAISTFPRTTAPKAHQIKELLFDPHYDRQTE